MGEYAVLDGGDAIVAAVNHGVYCHVQSGEGATTPTGDTRFVDAALAAISAPTRNYQFGVWNPVDVPHKVGLGGSAAACVAAIAAGRLAQDQKMGDDDLVTAIQVHHTVQGSGSGRDVMASYYGGVHRYSSTSQQAIDTPSLSIIHSGKSAQTAPRVSQYRSLHNRDAFVQEAAMLVDQFEESPVRALEEYGRLVEHMAQDAGFSYLTAAHERIRSLARRYGGAAKPSGAGGGDIAVALIPEEEARLAFIAACRSENLLDLPVEISRGVHWEFPNA